MTVTAEHAYEVYARADLLYSEEEIERALLSMTGEINAVFCRRDLLLLCIMKGGLVVMGKLLTRFDFSLQVDYIHVSRYADKLRGGQLHWLSTPSRSLRDREILLMDDILDEGSTLAEIVEYCKGKGARSVYSSVLVDKHRPHRKVIKADFVGLTVPDRYVFGYGMDYKGYLRNIPGIYAVKESP